jgi:hypothetical protein
VPLFKAKGPESLDDDAVHNPGAITPVDVEVFRRRMKRLEQAIANSAEFSRTSTSQIAFGVMIGIWLASIVPIVVITILSILGVGISLFGSR